MKEQIKAWLRREGDKLSGLSPRDKAVYIWDYYKLWITAAVVLAGFLIFVVHHTLTVPRESYFFACCANTTGDLGGESDFWQEFAGYAGYDLTEKQLAVDANCYWTVDQNTFTSTYYQAIVAYLDAGTLDVLLIGEEELTQIGASGRLMDLADQRTADLLAEYEDRIVYCEPLEGKEEAGELVPVGIDLSGTVLTQGEGCPYPDGCVLGISAMAPHIDQVPVFLDYLFQEAA